MSNLVKIFDRIKQLSYTTSTNDIELINSVAGFADFSSVYSHGDNLFYAITDGVDYEIGSGTFFSESNINYNYDTISRNPISSSNGGQKVAFNAGNKEVFVTYPASHSVYQGSGIGLATPVRGGVAFWDSSNILNYSSNLHWDNVNNLLGINNTNPSFAIDVAGTGDAKSSIRASGFYVGSTGIYFEPRDSYVGGTQVNHFTPNLLNTSTGSNLVFELSGIVNQHFLLKKQSGNTFFAGPVSSCQACPDEYPTFRTLVFDDIPNLSGAYAGVGFVESVSGNLTSYIDSEIVALSGYVDNNNSAQLQAALDSFYTSGESQLLAQSGEFENFLASAQGSLDNENTDRYCVVRGDNTDGYNAGWGVANRTVNYSILPLSGVELETTAGDWDTTNYWYTVPYSGNYSVRADLAFTYSSSNGDVDNYFRLVTSGDTVTNYLSTAAFMGDPDDGNASSSWIVNVNQNSRIYLEYKGQPRNYSKLTIHKI